MNQKITFRGVSLSRSAWEKRLGLGAGTLFHRLKRGLPLELALQPISADQEHNRTTHGMTGTKTHRTWLSMKHRCTNPSAHNWPNYGGRGIAVCERWMRFENFLEDMGVAPAGSSLDRINNDGNYEPGNCRWTDIRTQSNNTRVNRRITHDGRTLTLAEWARVVGIKPDTLAYRLDNGWPVAKALCGKASA